MKTPRRAERAARYGVELLMVKETSRRTWRMLQLSVLPVTSAARRLLDGGLIASEWREKRYCRIRTLHTRESALARFQAVRAGLQVAGTLAVAERNDSAH